MSVDYTSFIAVLQWIALAGGGAYLTGKVFAFLAENWVAWHGFPHIVKSLVPLLFSVGISVGSNILMQNTEIVAAIEPWFRMVALSVVAYYGTQVAYIQAKKAGYAGKIQE